MSKVSSRNSGEHVIDYPLLTGVGVTPEEVRILNLVKVVLNGGWVIDQLIFKEILSLSGIKDNNDPSDYKKDLAVKHTVS